MKVRVGQQINFNVRIGGEPAPEVEWKVAGKTLQASDRTTISSTETITKIEIKKAVRTDSGEYTITVKNASGKESASCHVVVVGKFLK